MTPAHHRGRQTRRAAPYAVRLFIVIGLASVAVAAIVVGHTSTPSSSHAGGTTTAPPRSTTSTTSPDTSRQTDQWRTLTAAVASIVRSRSDTVSVAVENLRDDSVWTYGSPAPQREASIVKVDILATLMARESVSGTTLTSSERHLAESMIEASDNDSATALWNDAGGTKGLAAFGRSIHLTATTPSPCVVCRGFPWPGWGLSTTTPRDQLLLLNAILGGDGGLTKSDSRFIIRLMDDIVPADRWGVASGVPRSSTVAFKNGWLPLVSPDSDWQINSIGWVSGAGRDYLVAVLSTLNATEAYGIATADMVSDAIWRAMAP